MKHLLTLFLGFLLLVNGFAQEKSFDVRIVQERPVTMAKVHSAKTVTDINPGYPASWIEDYVSVEVMTDSNGEIHKAISKNDILSTDQKALLKRANIGTDIKVRVSYILNNNLKKEEKEMIFAYTVAPDVEAQYPGGYEALEAFVKEKITAEISIEILEKIQLATINFSINELGEPGEARISVSSENERLDKLVQELINSMPYWSPAQNSDGVKVSQEFELSIGKVIGC